MRNRFVMLAAGWMAAALVSPPPAAQRDRRIGIVGTDTVSRWR